MADIMGWLVGGVVLLGVGWLILQLTRGGSLMIPGLGGSMSPAEVMSPGDLTPAQDSALDNNDMFGPETPLTADDGFDDNGNTCRCSDGNIWAFMGTNYVSTGRKAANCDCGQPGRGIVPTGTPTSITQGNWNAANVARVYPGKHGRRY